MIKDFKKILLFLIIILAFILRIYWLDRADMQGDEAVYAFVSVGYYDFLNSDQQTTPLQWFGYFPWWSKLSFHGAPPLVFLIQHLFFLFLGVSTFVARLPFVLFGTATVFLVYLLFKNKIIGLIAAFIMAILNYHIWASRTGYLEGIELFFILLSIYFFLKLLENSSAKNYFLTGLSLGLAFLCKYTMLFLIPAFFVYLLIFNRRILFNKKALLTILTFLIVISPVIIYNIMVYQTRGHLDLQFSQLLGMDISKDWPMFSRGMQKSWQDYYSNLKGIWTNLNSTLGNIIFTLFILSLIFIIFQLIRKKLNYQIILFLLFFLISQFTLISSGQRFLSIFTPLVAIVIAVFCHWAINQKYYKFIFIIFFIIFSFYLLLEDINTHLRKLPANPYNPVLRLENYGFEQLEDYLQNQKIDSQRTLIIFDNRLNWFCRFWYFYKQGKYFGYNYISTETYLNTIDKEGGDYFLKTRGIDNYYFILGVKSLFDQNLFSAANKFLEETIIQANYQPQLIYRDNGEVAFKVYNL